MVPMPPAGGAWPPIMLSEFVAAPKTVYEREWVELYNPGDRPVDLTGWRIDDEKEGSDQMFAAGQMIEAGAALLIELDRSILNNSGDSVRLLAPDGSVIDQVQYTKAAADQSISRDYGNATWSSEPAASPGQPNPQSQPQPPDEAQSPATDFSDIAAEPSPLPAAEPGELPLLPAAEPGSVLPPEMIAAEPVGRLPPEIIAPTIAAAATPIAVAATPIMVTPQQWLPIAIQPADGNNGSGTALNRPAGEGVYRYATATSVATIAPPSTGASLTPIDHAEAGAPGVPFAGLLLIAGGLLCTVGGLVVAWPAPMPSAEPDAEESVAFDPEEPVI